MFSPFPSCYWDTGVKIITIRDRIGNHNVYGVIAVLLVLVVRISAG